MILKIDKKHQKEIAKLKKLIKKHDKEQDKALEKIAKAMGIDLDKNVEDVNKFNILWVYIYHDYKSSVVETEE